MHEAPGLLTLPNELLKLISFYLSDDPVYNISRPQLQLLNFSMCCRQLRMICSPAIWRQFTMRRRTSNDRMDYTVENTQSGVKAWLVSVDKSTGAVTVPEVIVKYGSFVRCFKIAFSLNDPSFDLDWAMFYGLQKHCPGIMDVSVALHVLDDAHSDNFARFFSAVEQKLSATFRRLHSITITRNAFDLDDTPHDELVEVLTRLPSLRHFISLGVAVPQKQLRQIFAGKPIETAMFSETECDGDDPDAILSVFSDPCLLRDIAIGNSEFVSSEFLQPLTQSLVGASDTDSRYSNLSSLRLTDCASMDDTVLGGYLTPERFPYLRLLDMSGCTSIDCEKLLYYFRTHRWPRLYSLDLSKAVISMKMLPAIGEMCPNLRSLSIATEFEEFEQYGCSWIGNRIGKYLMIMLEKLPRLQLLEMTAMSPKTMNQLFGPNMPGVLRESLLSLRLTENLSLSEELCRASDIAAGLAKMKALRSFVIELEYPERLSEWQNALSGAELSRVAMQTLA